MKFLTGRNNPDDPETESGRCMLPFEPITLARKDELLPLYHAFSGLSCQHSFVSSYCMKGKYGDEVCVRDSILYTHRSLQSRDGERVYLFPLGDLSDKDRARQVVDCVLDDAHARGCRVCFETVTETAADILTLLFPGRFDIQEKRDYAEYLYSHDRLALLQGHDMASKRHDISTFEREYQDRYEVKVIRTPEQVEEIRAFQAWWIAARMNRAEDVQLEREDKAIQTGLNHFFELGLSGILVYIDRTLAGYAYGAKISDDCYDVMIEKGDRGATDIYKILNRDLVRLCCEGIAWINREEDLGVEGLRTAKLSYKPDRLLKKYLAREVDP